MLSHKDNLLPIKYIVRIQSLYNYHLINTINSKIRTLINIDFYKFSFKLIRL